MGASRQTIDNLRARFKPADFSPRWEGVERWGQPLRPDDVRLKPGTVGRRVRASSRAERWGVIVGAAVPPLPTLAQLRRGSPALAEPAYVIDLDGGGRVVVAGPRIRELNRSPREGLCPEGYVAHPLDAWHALKSAEAAAARGEVRHPQHALTGLPFAHRRGSSACCGEADVAPRKLRELVEAWRAGEGFEQLTEDDVLRLVRRAVPRGLDVKVRGLRDVDKALRAVEDHCVEQWREWLARAGRGRRTKLAEMKAAVRALVPQRKRKR